jgi:signal transduction histidine kinase
LPPEVAERLFEPFVSTQAGRHGVGLAFCQRIAEACGGGIAISMAEGSSGITITFSLRLVAA